MRRGKRTPSLTDRADNPANAGGAPPPPVLAAWTQIDLTATGRPDKVAVGIRLDSDVLAFFKDQGPGYQTRINQVLRAFIEAHKAGSA